MNAMWFPTKLAKYVLSEPVDDRQCAAAEPERSAPKGSWSARRVSGHRSRG
jgi:hypothetical protein